MKIVVAGAGAVGARAARQLLGSSGVSSLVVADRDERRAREVASSLGSPARGVAWTDGVVEGADAVLIALPVGADHVAVASAALTGGAHVVSVSDGVDDVRSLLALDDRARVAGRFVVVGAGFSPGLTCLLARHAAADFSGVDEVHVSKFGTAGPACARQHHAALAGESVDWRDGEWVSRQAGSGRELSWFPDPVGGLDCYRAAVPDALLLLPAFSAFGVSRITARMSATRRDRVTAWVPMLRKPHAEGTIGAVRVEVRGRRGPVTDVRVLGALDRPAVAAGAVAAVAVGWALDGRLAALAGGGSGGAGGLASLVPEPAPFLHELASRGIRAAVFEGAAGS